MVLRFYLDSNYNHVLVRYAKQIDAEKAIIAIDRSFFFSSWCRGKFRIFDFFFLLPILGMLVRKIQN